jgi:hypothetical protein
LTALEELDRVGGLSRFEHKILGVAKDALKREDGVVKGAALASYILWHLADAVRTRNS